MAPTTPTQSNSAGSFQSFAHQFLRSGGIRRPRNANPYDATHRNITPPQGSVLSSGSSGLHGLGGRAEGAGIESSFNETYAAADHTQGGDDDDDDDILDADVDVDVDGEEDEEGGFGEVVDLTGMGEEEGPGDGENEGEGAMEEGERRGLSFLVWRRAIWFEYVW